MKLISRYSIEEIISAKKATEFQVFERVLFVLFVPGVLAALFFALALLLLLPRGIYLLLWCGIYDDDLAASLSLDNVLCRNIQAFSDLGIEYLTVALATLASCLQAVSQVLITVLTIIIGFL